MRAVRATESVLIVLFGRFRAVQTAPPVHIRTMPQPPIELTGEAERFWHAHAARLEAEGTLTEADHHALAICATVWQRITDLQTFSAGAENYREMVQLANLTKQYHAYAKQFGLMPRERKLSKMDTPLNTEKDEFGL